MDSSLQPIIKVVIKIDKQSGDKQLNNHERVKMKKQIPAIILAITSTIFAVSLYKTKYENSQLRKELAKTEAGASESDKTIKKTNAVSKTPSGVTNRAVTAFVETEAPETKEQEEISQRRMMSTMVKMLEENPTMNRVMEASQRGAISALYSDLVEYLGLDAEETEYFMDLLMYRQMKNVDMVMKMMSGELTEEEKTALTEEVELAGETVKEGMENFLNDSEDYAEWEFYEDTVGERMMLSQMDQMLGDAALPEDTYREVLEIMHNERENFDWSTDLADNEKMDLSAERFSQENIQKHLADTKVMGEEMYERLKEILTPEQLEAWAKSGEAMQAMSDAQMQQAGQMFGGE